MDKGWVRFLPVALMAKPLLARQASRRVPVEKLVQEQPADLASMLRRKPLPGMPLDGAFDLQVERPRLAVSEAPEVHGAARRSVALSGEPVRRFEGAACAVAKLQRWRGREWLRLTALTIRQEAPRATPYIPSSASLNSRTWSSHRLAVYSCLQTRK